MTWTTFLIFLKLKTINFCNSTIHYNSECESEIIECVLDGEEFEWCKGRYFEDASKI